MLLETTSTMPEQMRAGLRSELLPMFEELRGFVDRRIQELSAEVAATVQIVDFSEENLSGQLSKIHEQILGLVAIPAANTRNSGIELEAVVQATETAANTIMEAAEAIQDWISTGSQEPDALRALQDKVSSIFEACSFQDVTGQRIRRAIQHLQQVETMLEGIVPTIAPTPSEEKLEVKALIATVAPEAKSSADLAQAEIDRLLNDF